MSPKPLGREWKERLPGRKAVTIAVGFICQDGIAICADRQMTSEAGYKFEERKIFYSSQPWWTVVFAYAGDPDAARIMFGKVSRELQPEMEKSRIVSKTERARHALERIFKSRDSKNVKSLIGIRYQSTGYCCMFRTSGSKVVFSERAHIGAGDSSALRYLCDFLLQPVLTSVNEASVLGSYIVSVATRYVDGCGGGPDITTVDEKGYITESTGGVFPGEKARFLNCEEQIGTGLRELLFSGATKTIVVK